MICSTCGRPVQADSQAINTVFLLEKIAPDVMPAPAAIEISVECFHASLFYNLDAIGNQRRARDLINKIGEHESLPCLSQAIYGLVRVLTVDEIFFQLMVWRHQDPLDAAGDSAVSRLCELAVAMTICTLSSDPALSQSDFFLTTAKAIVEACANLSLTDQIRTRIDGIQLALAGELMTSDLEFNRCSPASFDCVTVLAHALAHRQRNNTDEAEVLFHLLDPDPQHRVVFPEAFMYGCLCPQ